MNIKMLQFSLVTMPAHHLLYGNVCLDMNKSKIHPIGMATKKFISTYFLADLYYAKVAIYKL